MNNNSDYLEGVRAAQSYYKSHGYGYCRNIRAEDAIKIYLPAVTEAMIQVSTPLPKPRRDWIKGFKEEQAAILLENDPTLAIPVN